jgi:thioredoxin 1
VTLDTLQPTPTWDAESHPDVVDAFAALAADEAVVVHVWGADWCGDCRSELPDLAAALDAAAFPDERRHVHPVDREKDGELVAEYGVERIPTVVVERDGEELARFVEGEAVPAATYLAERLADAA